jgi:predicted nucleic acid-binding protein
MPDLVTDTHGLIWYLEDSPRLGRAARDVFDACDRGEGVIYVPTICLVEIVYLRHVVVRRQPRDGDSEQKARLRPKSRGTWPHTHTRHRVLACLESPLPRQPARHGRVGRTSPYACARVHQAL